MKQTGVSVGTTSETILAYSSVSRFRYLFIQNNHASQILYVRIDGGAAVADYTSIKIPAGKAQEIHLPSDFGNDITAIGSGAATTAAIAYGK